MNEQRVALTKWCPWTQSRAMPEPGMSVAPTTCLGQNCMAWRWYEAEWETRDRLQDARRKRFWSASARNHMADPSWVAVVLAGKHNTGSAKAPEPQRPADVPADWRWSGPEENNWEWAGWEGPAPDEETLHLHRMGRCGLVTVENRT